MHIGNDPNLERGLNGAIDKFVMVDYAWTPQEVQALTDGRIRLYASKNTVWLQNEDYSQVGTDDTAFWSGLNQGSGGFLQATVSNESVLTKRYGKAAKCTVSNVAFGSGYFNVGIVHVYSTPNNWTGYYKIGFWFRGSASYNIVTLIIKNSMETTFWSKAFLDDREGYRWIEFKFGEMDINGGVQPSLTDIHAILLSSANASTYYVSGMYIFKPSRALVAEDVELVNGMEESPVASDVLVLMDDSTSGWNTYVGGTGTAPAVVVSESVNTKMKGLKSMSIALTDATYSYSLIQKTQAATDYSAYDFAAFLEQQYVNSTVSQLKTVYTAVTGQQYGGANTKLSVIRSIVKNYIPDLNESGNFDAVINALVLFGVENAEWGFGCNCGCFTRMKPTADLAGWEPADPADIPEWHGADTYKCRNCGVAVTFKP
jgi:hypothetical protein